MKTIENLRICAPQASVPDSSILLTFFDVVHKHIGPIQRCYFFTYPHSTSHFLQSDLPNVKRSLSLTLQHFYPLAGKLGIRLSPGSDEQYEIRYQDGDSVPLLVAESEDDFEEVSGLKPYDTLKIEPLVPYKIMDDDLLTIQLTVFPNHGICIGFCIQHAACDGSSYAHFIKSWALICMSGTGILPTSMEPSIDDDHRAVLVVSLHELSVGYLKATPERRVHKGWELETDSCTTLNTVLRISYEEIEMLKASVRNKVKLLGKSLPHCSAYVVTCTYAWSCYQKLRRCSDDQKVCLTFPVDWRRRLVPPAPATYFGNCILPLFVEMKAGELVEEEFGLTFACESVGKKIKELESGNIRSSIEDLCKYPAVLSSGTPVFVMGCSNKFGVYGVDFGWGRPIKVESFVEEGFHMAENGDDPRGVEIGVVLPGHEMEEFVTIFRTGIMNLSQSMLA